MQGDGAFRDLQVLYERWGPTVQTYSQLFLGNADAAEAAVEETFRIFFRAIEAEQVKVDPRSSVPPIALLRIAVRATAACRPLHRRYSGNAWELAEMAGILPEPERSVFILRGVLDLDLLVASLVTGHTVEQIHHYWLGSLLLLRQAKGTAVERSRR